MTADMTLYHEAAKKIQEAADLLLAAVEYYQTVEQSLSHAEDFNKTILAVREIQWVNISVQLVHIHINAAATKMLPPLMENARMTLFHMATLAEERVTVAYAAAIQAFPVGQSTDCGLWCRDGLGYVREMVAAVRIFLNTSEAAPGLTEAAAEDASENLRKRVQGCANACFVRVQWIADAIYPPGHAPRATVPGHAPA